MEGKTSLFWNELQQTPIAQKLARTDGQDKLFQDLSPDLLNYWNVDHQKFIDSIHVSIIISEVDSISLKDIIKRSPSLEVKAIDATQ